MTVQEQIDLARRAVRGETALKDQGYQSPQMVQQLALPAAAAHDIHAVINVTASGSSTLIPGVVGQAIDVYELLLYTDTQMDLELFDGENSLTGLLKSWPAQTGFYLPPSDKAHFNLTAGNALKISTGAAGQVSGFIRAYRISESFQALLDNADLVAKYPFSQSAAVPNANGRHGRGMLLQGGSIPAFVVPLDNQPTWIVGFAFKGPLQARDRFLQLWDSTGAAEQVSLRTLANGGFTFTRNGTILATLNGPLFSTDTWHYIELKCTIADAGSFEVRLDGVTIMSGSADTKNTANAWADQIRLGPSGSSDNLYIDDLYIFDGTGTSENNFAGDSKVECLYVNAAGTYTQWTASAGSNYQNVDEAQPNDDTDYNSSSTAGQIDTYNLANTAFSGNIKGLTVTAWMRKDDAGTREVAIYTKSGVTETTHSTISLGNSYQPYLLHLWKDPNTAALWSAAAVNALEVGAKVIS